MNEGWKSDARFLRAVTVVLEHEGGYADHPNDPGGATNFGVSLRWLEKQGDTDHDGFRDGDFDRDGDVDADDIRAMSADDARKLYFEKWWVRRGYGDLELIVSVKLFDLAVNMGHGQAVKLLQRAVRAAGGPTLSDDGKLGPITRAAVGIENPVYVRACLRSEAAGFYRALVAAKSSRGVFLDGWLRRAYD